MIKEVRQSSNANVRLTQQAILYKGGKLGLLASVLGSFLFLCVYLGILLVSATLRDAELASEILLTDRQDYLFFFLLVYWTLGFLITFLVSIIPSVLAGVSHALILITLDKSNVLTSFRRVITGMLIGSIFSLIPIYIGATIIVPIVFTVASVEEHTQIIIEIMVSGILAASISGAWHGWRMTCYLDSSHH